MTKALLPLLKKHNVRAISVGVNPGTAPPAVPSPFVWKLRDSDPDGILAFWDKGLSLVFNICHRAIPPWLLSEHMIAIILHAFNCI